MTEKDWYVYVLHCADDTLYTGISPDPEARLRAHEEGRGARYTRGRAPLELVYQELCGSRACALRREAEVKRMSRDEKWSLIKGTDAP